MAKIKIDSSLFERMKKVVEAAGYSSVEEFVTHLIEREVAKYEDGGSDNTDRLRGLGYLD